MKKVRCNNCGAVTNRHDLLFANNPFKDDELIEGCPECASANNFTELCEKGDCDGYLAGRLGGMFLCEKHLLALLQRSNSNE